MKRCTGCGETKPLDEFNLDHDRPRGRRSECRACSSARKRRHYAENREQLLESKRRHYAENREAIQERKRRYQSENGDVIRERQRRHYTQNREQVLEQRRQYHMDLKAAVLAHYGEACACCGTTRNLAIDHVNGNGREHRLELFGRQDGGGGAAMLLWLIRNGFPDGFQTLCRRCNASKGDGSRCRISHRAGMVAAVKATQNGHVPGGR